MGIGFAFSLPLETPVLSLLKVFQMIPANRFRLRHRLLSAALAFGVVAGAVGTDAALAQAAQKGDAKKTEAAKPVAVDPNTPQATTATYGDWMVRCSAVPGQSGTAKVCEAALGLQAKGQEGLIAQVVIGRVAKDQPARLIVQLPNGVFLPAGATLYLDDKATTGIDTVFATCTQGCFADTELKTDQLAALKAAKGPGRLEFVDGNSQRLALPISFNGLNVATDAALNPKG